MPGNLPHDWEMSPRYRIFDSSIHRVRIAGKVGWQLHLIKQPSWDYSFLWLRPLDSSDDAGFVTFDARFDREWIFDARKTLQTLDKEIYARIGEGALARRFVLNTRGQLRTGNQRAHEILTVMRDGTAAWNSRKNRDETPFRWRKTPLSGADFVLLPAAQVWAELQVLLENSASEANFARRYARLEPLERIARIQKVNRGTLDELNQLLRDAVFVSPQWNDLQSDGELYLSVKKSGETAMWEVGRGNPIELEVPTFVEDNVRALWDHFQPFDSNIASFLCVQKSSADSLFARAFRPSAHEQLEAQLRLRDWCNSH